MPDKKGTKDIAAAIGKLKDAAEGKKAAEKPKVSLSQLVDELYARKEAAAKKE